MRREDGHTKWIKMMTVTTDLSRRSLEASFHPQERSASDSADKIVDFILYQDLTRFWPIGQTIKIPRPSQLFQRGCPVFIFHLWNLEGVYVTCVQTLKNHSPVRVKVWASKDLSFKTLNLGNQSHVRKILEESSFNKSNLIMKTSLYLAFHSLLSCHTWKLNMSLDDSLGVWLAMRIWQMNVMESRLLAGFVHSPSAYQCLHIDCPLGRIPPAQVRYLLGVGLTGTSIGHKLFILAEISGAYQCLVLNPDSSLDPVNLL